MLWYTRRWKETSSSSSKKKKKTETKWNNIIDKIIFLYLVTKTSFPLLHASKYVCNKYVLYICILFNTHVCIHILYSLYNCSLCVQQCHVNQVNHMLVWRWDFFPPHFHHFVWKRNFAIEHLQRHSLLKWFGFRY